MFCRLDVSSICIFYMKGNGTIVHQRATPLDSCRRSSVQSVRGGDGTSRSPSLQSNNSSCPTHGTTTLVTTNALLVSKITSSGEVTSTRQRWPVSSKWWTLPWPQSSLAEATSKPPKIPLNNKPSNILIQVTSDTVDDMINHDPQQTEQHPLQQVSDEEVAFV